MSEFPEGVVRDVTEEIMAAIKGHLAADEPHQPHHYNRTYEKVYSILDELWPEEE